ncbi:hypothetical protein BH10PLA2_BH10PLA2_33630 [soil metagenome]
MYSVPVILIGISDKLAAVVKRELAIQAGGVEAEYTTAETAIEGLSRTKADTRLLIVYVSSEVDLKQIRRLAELFRGWPIIALIETADQPDILVQANRAGATQVVPLPLRPADLQDSLSCIGLQQRATTKECVVIAFTGSSAGCGATTLATNAAYTIAAQCKQPTVLIELAQQMGIIATNLDVVPSCTLADLLAEPGLDSELVKHSLIRVADNFEILAGNQGIVQQNALSLKGVLRILDFIRPLAEFVVLDVPCTYTEFQFEILGIANQVVLVGEQSIASIRTLKLVLDALPHGTNPTKIHVVINRYDPGMEGLDAARLAKTLDLPCIQTIPDDRPTVLAAANEGKVLRQTAPNSAVLAGIERLVNSLLGVKDRPAQSSGTHLIRRFVQAFRK